MQHHDFTARILQWYKTHARTLPWRRTKDPYTIWVSEIILQQTRIDQGIHYFNRFLSTFPDITTLARADETQVMRLWQGLGYYTRARNLHKAARQMAQLGTFPTEYSAIRALPGVGDYTAAAVASLAFDQPYAVVDGNVYRVLSRYFAIPTPIDSTKGKKQFATLATRLLPRENAAQYNSALMDFGATQCTPANPDCKTCPLADKCAAFQARQTDKYPRHTRKTTLKNRYFNYIILTIQNKIIIFQRKENDIWRGLYEPLLIETDTPCPPHRFVTLTDVQNITNQTPPTLIQSNITHRLTHQLLHCNFYQATIHHLPTQYTTQAHIIAPDLIPQYPIPKPVTNILAKLFSIPNTPDTTAET